MYCFLIFADIIPKVIKEQDRINNSLVSSKSVATLTSNQSVKSEECENKELIMNPDCPVQILLDYICDVTGVDRNCDYDLCDETGVLLNIKTLKPWMHATDILQPKRTYIIVFLERNESGKYTRLVPLVCKTYKLYAELMLRLNKYLASRKSLDSKNRKYGDKSSKESIRTSAATSSQTSMKKHVKSKHGSSENDKPDEDAEELRNKMEEERKKQLEELRKRLGKSGKSRKDIEYNFNPDGKRRVANICCGGTGICKK